MPRTAATFPRYLAPRVREALTDTPVVLIHGPRQSGKSTLAQLVGKRRNYQYFSFDRDAVRAAAQQDAGGFVAGLPERVILDEVQRVPELFTALKDVVDPGAQTPSELAFITDHLLPFRDRDGIEVDIVLEQDAGTIAGVEVKASASVTNADFRGLRKLREAAGKHFVGGVVLYDGETSASFGDGLYAVPLRMLWEAV
jgi:predicted AAA+ superfamily ATPase